MLDYESTPQLQLIVAAIAGGKHAYAKLQVNLIDQNDNAPKFAQTKYVSAIWENNKPQTYVTQVRVPVVCVCRFALVCVCVWTLLEITGSDLSRIVSWVDSRYPA